MEQLSMTTVASCLLLLLTVFLPVCPLALEAVADATWSLGLLGITGGLALCVQGKTREVFLANPWMFVKVLY